MGIGFIIYLILFGLVIGALARLALPGPDPMGFVATVAVGIVCALVGWVLFTSVLGIGDKDKLDLGGIIGAVIRTMIVLALLRMVRRPRDAGPRPAAG